MFQRRQSTGNNICRGARRVRIKVQQQCGYGRDFTPVGYEIKESTALYKLCHLRVARKLIAGQNAAEAAGEAEYTIAFDKEEFRSFRKLAAE